MGTTGDAHDGKEDHWLRECHFTEFVIKILIVTAEEVQQGRGQEVEDGCHG